MKINSISVYKVPRIKENSYKYPLPFYNFTGFVFIKLELNGSIYGLGEPSPYCGPVNDIKKFFLKFLFPKIKNIEFEKICINKLLKDSKKFSNNYLLNSCCVAALDQAINDIKGKLKNLPVCKLLNPNLLKKNKIYLYASGGMLFEDQEYNALLDELCEIKNTFIGWKFRPKIPRKLNSHFKRVLSPPSFNIKDLIKFSQKARLAVGNDFLLMIDVGSRCQNLKEAQYLCKALSELNFFFIEEPINPDIYKYVILKKKLNKSLMIAGGESFYKKAKILNWINKKAIDIFQPDSNVSPISELYKISNKLIFKDIQVIPHNWCNMVSSASNFHFANSNNNIKYIEYNIIKNFYKNIFTYKFSYKNNSFDFSLAPGLGVDLTKSKELLKNISYEKKR